MLLFYNSPWAPPFFGLITMFLCCFCFLVCFVSSSTKSFFHIVIIVPSFFVSHYCYCTFPSHFTLLLLCLPLHFECCCFCALFLCHVVFVVPSLCIIIFSFQTHALCASFMPFFHVACRCYVWALCVCTCF